MSDIRAMTKLKNILNRSLLILASASFFVIGCAYSQQRALPYRAYALVAPPGTTKQANSLIVLDPSNWKQVEKLPLLLGNVSSFALDRNGRPWVAYSDNIFGNNDHRVLVVADGSKKPTILNTHDAPRAIAISQNRAFIACTQNGFGGAVDVFDTDTLAKIGSVLIPPPVGNRILILLSIAATKDKVVVSGMTDGSGPSKRHAAITVINPIDLKIVWQSKPISAADVWKILPYGDQFIMPNVASLEAKEKAPADILILKKDNAIEKRTAAARSPLWGAIDGNTLYLFHNATWNSLNMHKGRFISTHNLQNGKNAKFLLPDNFDASSLIASNKRVFLTGRVPGNAASEGLYEFRGGQLKILAKIRDMEGFAYEDQKK